MASPLINWFPPLGGYRMTCGKQCYLLASIQEDWVGRRDKCIRLCPDKLLKSNVDLASIASWEFKLPLSVLSSETRKSFSQCEKRRCWVLLQPKSVRFRLSGPLPERYKRRNGPRVGATGVTLGLDTLWGRSRPANRGRTYQAALTSIFFAGF